MSWRPLQPFPLCCQELADLVGTTAEAVIRVLSSFRRRGIVWESKGRLEINMEALTALASDAKSNWKLGKRDSPGCAGRSYYEVDGVYAQTH